MNNIPLLYTGMNNEHHFGNQEQYCKTNSRYMSIAMGKCGGKKGGKGKGGCK